MLRAANCGAANLLACNLDGNVQRITCDVVDQERAELEAFADAVANGVGRAFGTLIERRALSTSCPPPITPPYHSQELVGGGEMRAARPAPARRRAIPNGNR
jgi:hypothetical protein